MRKLIYWVATTVDGFIADDEHGVGAFLHEGEHASEYTAALKGFDTIVMGRGTYAFGLQFGISDPYPWADTVVFSRILAEAPPDPRVRFLATDPAEKITRLKARSGSAIYLCGGGVLASSLFEAGLIDELVLKVNPVLLGSGIPLSTRVRGAVRLHLREAKTYTNGVIVSRYDVAR